MKTLLYISMLGEKSLYDPEDYKSICQSGLEKDWILQWHGKLAKKHNLNMISADVVRDDPLPPPETIDSVILGGTIHLVLEDKDWLKVVLEWIKAYRKLRRPLLSFCGGHQMIAVNFFNGSLLTTRDSGLLIGTHKVRLTNQGKASALFQDLSDTPCFHFANSYHIVPDPALEFNVLATGEDSPAVVADFGHHWYGTQFHPESRRESWECYYKHDITVDKKAYKKNHDGAQLIENFFKISEGYQ